MDIKNLIIALLAATLGITALEATNVIDILNNNGIVIPDSNFKVNYVDEAKLKEWEAQHGKQMCSSGARHGYLFDINEVLGMIADAQANPPSPNDTLKGIIVYPYMDESGDMNIYLTCKPGKAINHPQLCPPKCLAY
ncbi:MAG: hypothetical protein RL065_1628 [Bacteroidota bacterium]|jgi:hypothetical protein